MSTLTKVLIVLQTTFSILLCGIVVTYVANEVDYKKMYDTSSRDLNSAKALNRSIESQWTEFKANEEKLLAENAKSIQDLKDKNVELTNAISREQAKVAAAEQASLGYKASVDTANITAQQQTKLYETAHAQLKSLESEQIRLKKEFAETNDALIEKMAVIATQAEKIRLLQEERSELQGKLEQYLTQYGKIAGPTSPVTTVRSSAQLARLGTQDIALKGVIKALDMENKLAEISIGSTDGVKENMNFKVSRNEQFVCNIRVVYVDAERSAGILELIQSAPQIGDKVSTNF